MDYLRRHGPFEPHRLALDELEYTTMPQVAAHLADRWEQLPTTAVPAQARGGRSEAVGSAPGG
jgi:fructose 1,6-bisphosphate aldolase/phosphatase